MEVYVEELRGAAKRALAFLVFGLTWALPVLACGRYAVACGAVDVSAAAVAVMAGIVLPSCAAWARAEAGFLCGCLAWSSVAVWFATAAMTGGQLAASALLLVVYWAFVPATGAFACVRTEAAH